MKNEGYLFLSFGINNKGELNLTWDLDELSNTALAATYPIGDINNGRYNTVEITLDESEVNSKSSTIVALQCYMKHCMQK